VKTSPSFFFNPIPPVQQAVAVAVEKAGKVIEQATRIARLKARVRWYGYKVIECGGNSFAFCKPDNEGDRCPSHGGYTIEDAERFVRARENESRW